MIPTKNSINNNDFVYSYDWHVLKMSQYEIEISLLTKSGPQEGIYK